jgi:hypothetical protein
MTCATASAVEQACAAALTLHAIADDACADLWLATSGSGAEINLLMAGDLYLQQRLFNHGTP